VREAGGEFVETAAEAKRPGRGARRAAKMRERVRVWSRARKDAEQRDSAETLRGDDAAVAAVADEGADGIDEGAGVKGKRRRRKSSGTRLRTFALLAAMPIMAKLGLLLTIASIFLRIGAVTFGGGYVMVPLIEAEVVHEHGWLTHREFVEAFALGQVTPGPVLITATFIGYRVAGTLGALVATVSIFLPSLVLTVVAGSSLRRFRANRQVQAFLRGVTPAVVGLLVAAACSVGRAGIHTWVGLLLAVASAFVLMRFRVNAFLVILGAAVLRFAVSLFGL
jgi:chromate transporter